MDALLQNPAAKIDKSVLEVMTSVQKPFFEFRDAFDTSALDDVCEKVFYAYRFPVNGSTVTVRCANTAWMSRKKELPGSLYFPESLVPKARPTEFAITIFHHPYNWLTPLSKQFIKKVESTSDLVLTGHEHSPDRSVKIKPDSGLVTSYVEAAALQDSDPESASAFNVLLVDIAASREQFHHFVWCGDHYENAVEEVAWEPLALKSQHAAGRFHFTESFHAWLRDSGIPSRSRGGKVRTLDDVFVYPDLREVPGGLALSKRPELIKSDQVFDALSKLDIVLLTGDPKSGRTALARKLVLDFHASGFVPIYCETLNSLRQDATMPQVLVRKAKSQFGEDYAERFRQLDRRNRVLIVDDVDRSSGRLETRRQAVENLRLHFGHIVLIGDDAAGKVMELAPAADAAANTSKAYGIQPLGHVLVEQLSQQWFSKDDAADDLEHSLQLEKAATTLATVMGRNYVPSYPIFVIAVLQAIENGEIVNVNVGTHGYFYEILIKSALGAVDSENTAVSIRLAFLTHVAYEMFCTNKLSLAETELHDSYRRYQTKYEVGGLGYKQLIDSLVERGMLVREVDVIRFRYPYLFFYFVANHLKRLDSAEMREKVQALAKDLSNEQSSDIMMFLVHLGNDAFVIEEIRKAAESFFQADSPATLDKTSGEDADVTLEYVDIPQDQARIEAAAAKDRQLAAAESDVDDQAGTPGDDAARAFSAALYTVRLVGQILRNNPGLLEGEVKAKLAQTSCALGLRTLSAATRILEDGKEKTVARIISEVRRTSSVIAEDRLRARAERYVEFLKTLAAFGLIRTVASSISAPELEPTFRRVFNDEASPAMQLIRASVNMEFAAVFPGSLIERTFKRVSGHNQASFLLKVLVLDRFQRVFVDQGIRQRICAKLGIKYTGQLVANTKYKALR